MKNHIPNLPLTKTERKAASKERSPCGCPLVLAAVQEYAKALGFALGVGRSFKQQGPKAIPPPVAAWHTFSFPTHPALAGSAPKPGARPGHRAAHAAGGERAHLVD